MPQSIRPVGRPDAQHVDAPRSRKALELRVSFDVAGEAGEDVFAQLRRESVWLGSIAIAIDGEIVGALDISGSGLAPDTIVAHAPPTGFGHGGG